MIIQYSKSMSDPGTLDYVAWPCGRKQHVVITSSSGVRKKYVQLPRGPRHVTLSVPRLRFVGSETDCGVVHYVFARDGCSSPNAGLRETLFKLQFNRAAMQVRIEPTADFNELVQDCALCNA